TKTIYKVSTLNQHNRNKDPSPTSSFRFFFFFNDTAPTELYTLSLHDALPIFSMSFDTFATTFAQTLPETEKRAAYDTRSEEHTSELLSRLHLVCRLLLEK